jgi:stage II sporulation protein D
VKKNFVLSLLIIFTSPLICLAEAQLELADQEVSMPSVKRIRVLLEEHAANKESKFIVKSRHGFVIESPADSENTALYQEKELRLVCKNNRLYLKCHDDQYRRIKYDSIEICDPHHKLTLGGVTYQGSLTFRVDEKNNSLLVINKLPLEDYVYSVVRYEGIPSWPLGMQKVQAIISRTYAVFLMQQARVKNPRYKYYDIKNTNLHQVYNGTHNYTHLRQAIDETQNLILTYKGHIALTMFDICCGGSTPGLMRQKDTSKPYLCRKEPCPYCKSSPNYQWKIDLHAKSFLQQLKAQSFLSKRLNTFKGEISDVKIVDIDKAGIVQKVKIYDKNKKGYSLTGNAVRSIQPNKIKSLSFSIKKIRDRIVISGKGYGHQRGACQWGCKELVCRGWSIKSILNFYYPGTKLSRLL